MWVGENEFPIAEEAEIIVPIDEDVGPGFLLGSVNELVSRLGLRPRAIAKGIDKFGVSFRSLETCRGHFGSTSEQLKHKLSWFLLDLTPSRKGTS